MTTIRFRLPGGDIRTIDAKDGESLMRIAVDNDIEEIEGECGGAVSCATCHVYLPDDVFDKVTPSSRDENDLLEVMDTYRRNSRLGCQVRACELLEGAEIEVPPAEN